MRKSKSIISLLTSIAMTGSIFGSIVISKTVYAKTQKINSITSIEQKFKNNINSENLMNTHEKNNFMLNNKISYKIAAALSNITKERISGSDRYDTSAQIAQCVNDSCGSLDENYNKYAIIATGENYPDALCAAPLAAKYNAPILLTESSKLSESAKNVLSENKINNVIIVGGTGAVSAATEDSIKDLNISVKRISGINRYETSEKVAEEIGTSSEVVVATGNNFPDALSIAVIAAQRQMPILLTDLNSLPEETKTYLSKNNITKTYVIGGTGVISETVEKSLKNPQRLSGNDRYETNLKVLSSFSSILNNASVFIATGRNFPDALSCSVLASALDSPLILADTGLDNSARTYIGNNINSLGGVVAVGGTGAVPDSLLDNAAQNFGKAFNNPVVTNAFKDKNLEKFIRNMIDKPVGDFYQSDLNAFQMFSIDSSVANVSDYTGIDKLINLKDFYFNNSDLSLIPLKSYKKLKKVFIYKCNNADLSLLKDVEALQKLGIADSSIKDISVLGSLTNLKELYIDSNLIKDVSSIKTLTNLNKLTLNCAATDISAISSLSNLKSLIIYCYNFTDISKLSYLTNLEKLYISGYNVKDFSCISKLIKLKSLNIYSSSFTNLSFIKTLTNLNYLNVGGYQLNDISDIKYLTNLNYLELHDSKVINFSPINNLTKLSALHLSNNNITTISKFDKLTNLNNIYLDNNNIDDISPLNFIPSLRYIDISNNNIANIPVLDKLSKVNGLSLNNNQIAHISNLSSLNNLNNLEIYLNKISDISEINSLKNIKKIDLSCNSFTTIPELNNLSLNDINLYGNKITDISGLKGLKNLKVLDLEKTGITDISTLKALTNLQQLSLENNTINNISPLEKLTKLTTLNLSINKITDISKLQELSNLRYLYLNNNDITKIDALMKLTNLSYLNLYYTKVSKDDINALKVALPRCQVDSNI